MDFEDSFVAQVKVMVVAFKILEREHVGQLLKVEIV